METCHIRKLRVWLKKRGFSLKLLPAESEVCFEKKSVTLQRNLTLNSKVATLLHECGHVLVYLARRRSKGVKVAGASWRDWQKLDGKRNKLSCLLELQEEMVAWDRGEKLGQRLRLKLPSKYQTVVKTKALMSYVRYTAC